MQTHRTHKKIFILIAIGTIFIFLSRCDTIGYEIGAYVGYKVRMDKLKDDIYQKIIPLNPDPIDPWRDKTLLGTVPPLKICIVNFQDVRVEISGKIPQYQISVDSLVTKAVSNEFKRNKHILITDRNHQSDCDFLISGKVIEFFSLPLDLIEDQNFRNNNKKYSWITRIVLEIDIEGITNCNLKGTRKYFKESLVRWTSQTGREAVPTNNQVGKCLDEMLLKVIKEMANDKEFIQLLLCKSNSNSE